MAGPRSLATPTRGVTRHSARGDCRGLHGEAVHMPACPVPEGHSSERKGKALLWENAHTNSDELTNMPPTAPLPLPSDLPLAGGAFPRIPSTFITCRSEENFIPWCPLYGKERSASLIKSPFSIFLKKKVSLFLSNCCSEQEICHQLRLLIG